MAVPGLSWPSRVPFWVTDRGLCEIMSVYYTDRSRRSTYSRHKGSHGFNKLGHDAPQPIQRSGGALAPTH